jgi:hypothetical protein
MDIETIVSELKSERDRIDRAISALLDGFGPATAAIRTNGKSVSPKRGRGITPAGRRRLSQAMKARWAARKSKPAGTSRGQATGMKRRSMSAAGRRLLSETMKKRWAEKKKAPAKAGG